MAEEREIWDVLRDSGFLHALREAHEATTRIVFGALSRSAGFKDRSYGYTSFDVLESQLDKVCEPLPDVVRDNLNGSPGWRYGPYRVILRRHELGAVDAIRWDKASPTKQAVSRQEFPEDPQLTLDFEVTVPEVPDGLTLVLAHSASEAPMEMELFLGRPRYNADGGKPWHWRRPLTPESLGPDPRRSVERTMPLWDDDAGDVPVRLRDQRGQRPTGTETAR